MLNRTIKTNINTCKREYKSLGECVIMEETNDKLFVSTDNVKHNLMPNDEVLLYRADGQRIEFSERVGVDSINSNTTFTMKQLGRVPISPMSYETVTFHNHSVGKGREGTIDYIKFTFSEENKHIFCRNMDGVEEKGIKVYYYWDDETGQYTNNGHVFNITTNSIVTDVDYSTKTLTCSNTNEIGQGDTIIVNNINGENRYYTVKQKSSNRIIVNETIDSTIAAGCSIYKQIIGFRDGYLCDGDYVLYDGTFLKQIRGGVETDILNIDNAVLYYDNGDEEHVLNACIVPVNTNGYDNRYELLIAEEELEGINIDLVSFYCDDTRFWCLNNSDEFISGTTIKNGTTINKITGDIEFELGLTTDFSNDLYKLENFTDHVKEVANSSVTPIINYERYTYHPMYYWGEIFNMNNLEQYLASTSSLSFNLNFRKKNCITYDSGYTYDYASWSTDETGYWNNYTIGNDEKLVPVYDNGSGKSIVDSDLLGHLGFTDEDVFYQSSALKNSFLRLSFYDSPYRETQKLLHYSTIYFDTNALYKKYCDILAEKERKNLSKDKQYVYDADVNKNNLLTATLTCSDKYNTETSADGFYIHLFDKMVQGNMYTTIYMKAEFNNAKFGKTVPLTMPSIRDVAIPDLTVPLSPSDTDFPINYFYNGNTQTVNMQRLLSDMYVRLYIKFDFNRNQFIWFLPMDKQTENVVLNLYEPRINEYNSQG